VLSYFKKVNLQAVEDFNLPVKMLFIKNILIKMSKNIDAFNSNTVIYAEKVIITLGCEKIATWFSHN
jgi:hypothetical protein